MAEITCRKCGTVITLEQSDLDSVVRQVRDEEFARDLQERMSLLESQKASEIKALKDQASVEIKALKEQALVEAKALKDQASVEIKALKDQASASEELAVTRAVAALEKERDAMAAQVEQQKAEVERQKAQALRTEADLKQQMSDSLKAKDEMIDYLREEITHVKDMKARLSTKLLGESLEQHCHNEFDRIRAAAFPNAYFEKDNEVVEGSKGDFVFRELDKDGVEIISIMFEMKTEDEDSTHRKKNEDHFKTLDKNRTKKGCEYAVLVSTLEADNDLYNAGIVDVSHRYEKMYVVRPQCFIPIITLLYNAAQAGLKSRQELALMKRQELDVTNFELKLNDFKAKFEYNFGQASKRYEEAISAIDKAIADLQKTRELLTKSEDQLGKASKNLDRITVKALVRGNPTMKEKFEAVARAQDGDDIEEAEDFEEAEE